MLDHWVRCPFQRGLKSHIQIIRVYEVIDLKGVTQGSIPAAASNQKKGLPKKVSPFWCSEMSEITPVAGVQFGFVR